MGPLGICVTLGVGTSRERLWVIYHRPETDGGLSQSQRITHGRDEVELPVQLLSFASAEGTDVKVCP